MTKDSTRQIGIIVATIVMIVGFVFSRVFPNDLMPITEVNNKFSIYFVPASYTFSIWGLIFLGLVAYSIYQALPAQKTNKYLRRIGWWYVGGSLSLVAWTYFWRYQLFVLMMVAMIGVLISLLSIYQKLNIGLETKSRGMRFLVHIPFSIFLGWITMATIANVAQVFDFLGWTGYGISAKIWTVVLIVMALIIAELTAFNRQDLAYLAVFVWSFIGIAVEQVGVSPIFEAACVAAMFVVIIAAVTIMVTPKLKKKS